jgi:hypothetical protein
MNSCGTGREYFRAVVRTVMKLPGSIKCVKLLDCLRNCQLVKKNSAPWISLVGNIQIGLYLSTVKANSPLHRRVMGVARLVIMALKRDVHYRVVFHNQLYALPELIRTASLQNIC